MGGYNLKYYSFFGKRGNFTMSGFHYLNLLIHFEKTYTVENYTVMAVISSFNLVVVDLSYYNIQLTNVDTQEQLNIII